LKELSVLAAVLPLKHISHAAVGPFVALVWPQEFAKEGNPKLGVTKYCYHKLTFLHKK
jgi:hypothetical protein